MNLGGSEWPVIVFLVGGFVVVIAGTTWVIKKVWKK